MGASVQDLVKQANRRTQTARNRQFVKRSSDQQMLDHLAKNGRCVLDIYHEAVAKGLNVGTNLRAAMREFETAVCMAEKRVR